MAEYFCIDGGFVMYDEGAAGGGGGSALGGVKRMNLEGLIPLILLVIIGVAGLNYIDIIDVPILPKDPQRVHVMFIGEPSLGEKVVLDNLFSFLTYRVRAADSFGNAASEELNQYDIVFLDQSNTANKSVTVALGEAIQKYVSKGGKLVVVMNSGIYQSVGFQGLTAADVVGWKATFGKIIPAECVPGYNGVPSCREGSEISVVGRIWQQDFEHPIMQGIEVAPPMGDAPVALRTLAVQADEGARTIAYIKAENTPQSYPA
ncbi:MAG: hypothetical protein NTY48_00640, partial [Candidatus Diapherotrites archaeon]|nr:hypothetical protein [Candidatus Diapherotrites archaeon]